MGTWAHSMVSRGAMGSQHRRLTFLRSTLDVLDLLDALHSLGGFGQPVPFEVVVSGWGHASGLVRPSLASCCRQGKKGSPPLAPVVPWFSFGLPPRWGNLFQTEQNKPPTMAGLARSQTRARDRPKPRPAKIHPFLKVAPPIFSVPKRSPPASSGGKRSPPGRDPRWVGRSPRDPPM